VRVFIFKPDGIGDFVLTTGALRTLAVELGEENLVICVRSILVPLAKSQFPNARILELPTAAKRKVLNLFARNIIFCLPLALTLRTTHFDAAICFRSMRNYLETFLFYVASTKHFFACENLLLRNKRRVRAAVEDGARRIFRTTLVPYPAGADYLPSEIEAHRLLVSRVLERPVAAEEILPTLRTTGEVPTGHWICAPITNLGSKIYPLPLWVQILVELQPQSVGKKIFLTGASDDRERLEGFLSLLQAAGVQNAEIVLPPDLEAYVNLMAGADLVLTIDTAAAHFATALDRPTLVLFSALHRGMFGPWSRSDKQVWLLPELGAGESKPSWPRGVPPPRAAAAARKILKTQPQRGASKPRKLTKRKPSKK